MATKYAQGVGDWTDGSSLWFDAPTGGSGVSTPGVGDTADLNGNAVALDDDAECDEIVSSNAAGYLEVLASRTVTADITHSSSSSSGMIRLSSGTLTIYGCVTNSSTGNAIVPAAGTTCVIDNGSGNAIYVTNGDGWHDDSGAILDVTGAVYSQSGGNAVYANGAASEIYISNPGNDAISGNGYSYCLSLSDFSILEITGDIRNENTADLIYAAGGGDVMLNGTMRGEFNGIGRHIRLNSSTFTWVGNHTIPSGEHGILWNTTNGSSIIFATETDKLTLTNNGHFRLLDSASSPTYVMTAAGGTASIVEGDVDAGTIIDSLSLALSDIVIKYGAGGGGGPVIRRTRQIAARGEYFRQRSNRVFTPGLANVTPIISRPRRIAYALPTINHSSKRLVISPIVAQTNIINRPRRIAYTSPTTIASKRVIINPTSNVSVVITRPRQIAYAPSAIINRPKRVIISQAGDSVVVLSRPRRIMQAGPTVHTHTNKVIRGGPVVTTTPLIVRPRRTM